MTILRRLLLIVVAPLFSILLYGVAINYGIMHIAGEPGTIKQVLATSGIYNSVLSGLLDEAKTVNNGSQSVSLKDSPIKTAAEQTFTPAFIKTNTETVIDSLYRWLDGTTVQPDFKIDLTATKASFAKNAGAAVEAKLSSLPVCPTGTSLTAQNFDSETAICLPPSISPSAEAAKVEQNILNGQGFLDHPVITAASVKDPGTNQVVFASNLKHVPDAFQWAKASPYILASVSLLLGIAIIFLSSTRRKGIRRVGVLVLISGIFLLGAAYALNWSINGKTVASIKLNNAVLEKKVIILVKDIGGKIDNTYWAFGIGYSVVGAGLVIGSLIGKKGKESSDKNDLEGEGQTPEDRIELKEPVMATPLAEDKKPRPTKAKPAPQPVKKPRPAPKKIIIQ